MDFIKKTTGFSLTETIISLALGLLIALAAMMVYKSNLKINNQQQALFNIQANAQNFAGLLETEIFKAGIIGCNQIPNPIEIYNYSSFLEQIDQKIYSLPAQIKLRIKPDSDILVIKKINPNTMNYLAKPIGISDLSLDFAKPVNFEKLNKLVITDCQSLEFIDYNKTTNKPILDFLAKSYPKDSLVSEYQENIYYIADTLRKKNNGDAIYSLYMTDLHNRTIELIENIELFKVNNSQDKLLITTEYTDSFMPNLTKVFNYGFQTKNNS